jgi:hypothetical protein
MSRLHRISILISVLTVMTAMAIPGGVVIEGRLDGAACAGQMAPLTISISKGGLDYFGRMMLRLPPDCRLEPQSLFGGSYHWDEEENLAVVSWLKLPERERFDLEFDLLISPDANPGERQLEWEFSFIRNNDRATVHPAPFTFAISAPPVGADLDERSPLPRSASSDPIVVDQDPAAVRNVQESQGHTRVQIELANLTDGGFAKLTETIPEGCTCQVLAAAGGVAQIVGNELNILWFDYTQVGPVSYQLDNCLLSHAQNFNGTLSCVVNGASMNFSVIHAKDDIKGSHAPSNETAKTSVVTFEVQVAATKKPVSTDYFERKLNFRHQTREERSSFWVRYTHESFKRYEEARNHRNELTEAYAFNGPFVVARKGDRRITVQEALTISDQQWLP